MEKHQLYIPQLDCTRTIRIWLPPDYSLNNNSYPVIYMHDGQNLFDRETAAYGEIWDAHGAVLQLMQEHPTFKGAIIVGIDNANGLKRLDEYSPWVSPVVETMKSLKVTDRPVGGDGEAYSRFIVETLKPFVDGHYRTRIEREHTYLVGSSMGGFISLYMGAKFPHLFAGIGAFSTAAWFAQEPLVKCLSGIALEPKLRWYLDVGTEETSNEAIEDFNTMYIEGTIACTDALKAAGVSKEQIKTLIVEGAIHNEKDWAVRLPEALRWLLQLT